MKNWLISLAFLAIFNVAQSQNLRYFLDAPALFVHSPDLKNIDDRVGLGGEFLMNFATHHFVGRVGFGAAETVQPKADDLQKSLRTSPWARVEIGLGLYRTNGQKCSRTNANAWSAMALGGVVHDFQSKKTNALVGAEFGHFFIRDVRRNTEIFLRGGMLLPENRPTADFGFRVFFNLRA